MRTVEQKTMGRQELRDVIFAQMPNATEAEVAQLDACLQFTQTMRAGYFNGKIVCAWGMIPPTLMSDQAYLWLYTTPELVGNEFLFVRHSQMAVQEMLKDYPRIVGQCRADNTRAIRWIRWLGGVFDAGDGALLNFVIQRRPVNG